MSRGNSQNAYDIGRELLAEVLEASRTRVAEDVRKQSVIAQIASDLIATTQRRTSVQVTSRYAFLSTHAILEIYKKFLFTFCISRTLQNLYMFT